MDNNAVPISRSNRASPEEMIPTEDNPDHLLCATIASFETIMNRGIECEGHQTDDQELTANPTGNWGRTMKTMTYMPKELGHFQSSRRT